MMRCDLPGSDLVAYADGDLQGARREFVEAHLQVCSVCRRRSQAFQNLGRLLREQTPPVDDPVGRAVIRARIEGEVRRRLPRHRLILAAVPLIVLVLITSGSFSPTEADFQLGHFIRGATVDRTPLSPSPGLAGAADPARDHRLGPVPLQSVDFPAVAPEHLPRQFTLADWSVSDAGRLHLLYQSPERLTIQVLQSPSATSPAGIPPNEGRLIIVRGREVLWQPDPWPGSVSRLVWTQHGVLFDVLVIDAPYLGLPLTDARDVVDALMVALDDKHEVG